MSRKFIDFDGEKQAERLKSEISIKKKENKEFDQYYISEKLLFKSYKSTNFIINGKRRLTEPDAEVLGKFFGVRPEYLMGKDDCRTEGEYTRMVVKSYENAFFQATAIGAIESVYPYLGYTFKPKESFLDDIIADPSKEVKSWDDMKYQLCKGKPAQDPLVGFDEVIGEIPVKRKEQFAKDIKEYIQFKFSQLISELSGKDAE